MFDRQIDVLAKALQRPLPGPTAQRLLAPELSCGRHFAPPPHDARQAAVLVLLYPGPSGWRLPLIVRPGTLEHHAGQIGLPGGLIEPGETSWQAALRELEEELGVAAAGIVQLGQLSPLYIYASNHYVSTWVAALEHTPQFSTNMREVAELLEVPLAHLFDSANRGVHERTYRGARFQAPHFSWGDHQIWGATAMILAELVAAIQESALRTESDSLG
jgi:8-oxo-dGTP pyrophosphatase MutT (NUDIX family)